MKLYNIFEEVILEEINKVKTILTEDVSDDKILDAIRNKYNVNILYLDDGQTQPSKRYIQVYNLSNIKGSNNKVIRAYQIFGGSRTTKNGWKIFRTDRIVGWYPTNMKWSNPVSDTDSSIPAYNQLGDKSMNNVIDKVNPNTFTRQRSDIAQRPTNNNKIENK